MGFLESWEQELSFNVGFDPGRLLSREIKTETPVSSELIAATLAVE